LEFKGAVRPKKVPVIPRDGDYTDGCDCEPHGVRNELFTISKRCVVIFPSPCGTVSRLAFTVLVPVQSEMEKAFSQ